MKYMHELSKLAISKKISIVISNMIRTIKEKEVENMKNAIDPFTHIKIHLSKNSSKLNKGNHNHDDVRRSDLNQQRFLLFHLSVFFLVLVSVEKVYQTQKTVFHHISKRYAARRIFNFLLSV